MGPTDEGSTTLRKSLGHKLTKRKVDTRRVSLDVPERLKDVGDDDKEDVTAATNNRYLNQSIFSLITAAGSTVDFQSRFDEAESESDDDGEAEEREGMSKTVPGLRTKEASTPPKLRESVHDSGTGSRQPTAKKEGKHQRQSSTSRLLKSMHKLRLKPIRERKGSSAAEDHMSASQILEPPSRSRPTEREEAETTSGDAPMLSRIIQAEAEMQASTMLEEEHTDEQVEAHAPVSRLQAGSTSLAQRLMDIFGFDEPENVISEWPCWLLQSVLVQGFLYVTQKHICFYAYLPKKAVSRRIPATGNLTNKTWRPP
jgi:sterol 3beta-glucosyltransferase